MSPAFYEATVDLFAGRKPQDVKRMLDLLGECQQILGQHTGKLS